jgi:hypothetical protein
MQTPLWNFEALSVATGNEDSVPIEDILQVSGEHAETYDMKSAKYRHSMR